MTEKPRKLTDERMEALVGLIRKGIPITEACRLVRMGRSTFYKWLDYANEGREPYVEFATALEQAQAELVEELNGVVLEAAVQKRNWQAAMTWLERYDPERWGRNTTVRMEHRPRLQAEAEVIDVVDITEELDRRLMSGEEATEDDD